MLNAHLSVFDTWRSYMFVRDKRCGFCLASCSSLPSFSSCTLFHTVQCARWRLRFLSPIFLVQYMQTTITSLRLFVVVLAILTLPVCLCKVKQDTRGTVVSLREGDFPPSISCPAWYVNHKTWFDTLEFSIIEYTRVSILSKIARFLFDLLGLILTINFGWHSHFWSRVQKWCQIGERHCLVSQEWLVLVSTNMNCYWPEFNLIRLFWESLTVLQFFSSSYPFVLLSCCRQSIILVLSDFWLLQISLQMPDANTKE